MKARLLILLFVAIWAACAAEGNYFEDLNSLPREKRYSYDADDFLTRYQDSELKRSLSDYQDYLDRRSMNGYSYSDEQNGMQARTSFDQSTADDMYADVEYKRAIITTVPANTSVCLRGFSVDSAGDAWCEGDAFNTRRRAYEVRWLRPLLASWSDPWRHYMCLCCSLF